MTSYCYIARDRSNRLLRGQISASCPVELRSRLCAVELQLVSFDDASPTTSLEFLKRIDPQRWLPVRSRDVELVLHQLAIMLRSGLKLLDALKALQMQAQRYSMARLLETIHDSIGKGETLSAALARHKVFPPIVVQLVSVGEHTGSLETALQQSREYLVQRRTIITELRVAVSYPAVVTLAALSVAVYLVVAVIPQLQTFLSALGRDLPAMTRSLIDLSHWLRSNGVILVSLFGTLGASIAVMLYWQRGRLLLDQCLLRLPIIGDALRLSGTAGLAGSLAIMLQSGIRLVQAMKISSGMQSNSYLASIAHNASASVARGNPLASALAAEHGFTPILPSMVEVAERTGQLDGTLNEVAKLCNSELKAKIKRMSQCVEPAVILLAGGIVGYVYIAFFIALMSAGGGVR